MGESDGIFMSGDDFESAVQCDYAFSEGNDNGREDPATRGDPADPDFLGNTAYLEVE